MATAQTNSKTAPNTEIQKNTADTQPFLFDKQNYMMMGLGLLVIILGFILMAGGKSPDPNVFDEKAIYSTTRITIAPILVLLGLAIEGYAIMKRPKK